ncbi:MAG TPA: energy transducer TonB [Candidatus Angelobacter sp.]|nr:energy transducer TonB [Candidatus Angelobacter sp.]
MRARFTAILIIAMIAGCTPLLAQVSVPHAPAASGGDFAVPNPAAKKIPTDVILVKGAVPSSSDPAVPVPEGGAISEGVYTNQYFGIRYPLPPGFVEKYSGPPPSDSGYYVLAELEPKPKFQAAAAGSVLVSAQDLFFGLVPADNALSLVNFRRDKLGPYLKIERQPTEVKVGNQSFIRFDYMSPVAGLHWYTLTTEVRCHAVQFQFTSRDPQLAEIMVQQLAKSALGDTTSSGAPSAPVCIKNYASGDNVLQKVAPVFTGRKFNRIPVRIVIDKYGKVKYVHVISAFPDQIKAITDALQRWEFRPYRINGKAVEVETGIMFGAQPVEPGAAAHPAQVMD